MKQQVVSSIPSQGTCLGCEFGPRLGPRSRHVQESTDQYFSLSLSPSLTLSLKNKLVNYKKTMVRESVTVRSGGGYRKDSV